VTVRDDLIELVQNLGDTEAALVREYAEQLLWEQWDRQIVEDSQRGRLAKLDALADKAHRDRAAGRTTPL